MMGSDVGRKFATSEGFIDVPSSARSSSPPWKSLAEFGSVFQRCVHCGSIIFGISSGVRFVLSGGRVGGGGGGGVVGGRGGRGGVVGGGGGGGGGRGGGGGGAGGFRGGVIDGRDGLDWGGRGGDCLGNSGKEGHHGGSVVSSRTICFLMLEINF